MKKLIDEEIRQRVDEELKKLGRNPRKDVASSVSKAVARKLFLSPDSEGEEKMTMKQLSSGKGYRRPLKLMS